MKKMYLAISLISLSFAYSSFIPANAQSFWHQLKDQAFNRHGGQYGYYPSTYSGGYQQTWAQQPLRVRTFSSVYGNGHNNSGIYGNQQGLRQQQLQQHQLQEHQQLERQQQYFGY